MSTPLSDPTRFALPIYIRQIGEKIPVKVFRDVVVVDTFIVAAKKNYRSLVRSVNGVRNLRHLTELIDQCHDGFVRLNLANIRKCVLDWSYRGMI